jgi:lipopolysaccharide exporter
MTSFRRYWNGVNLRTAVRNDTGKVIGTLIILNVVRLVSTLALTRLLNPEDYGVLGLITVTHYAIVMLSDLGIDSYIVRNQVDNNRKALDVIWTIKAIRLIAIGLVVAMAAWPLAHFFGNPHVAPAIAFSALSFVVLAPQSLSISLAVRHQKIGVVSLIDIGLALFTLFASLVLALVIPNYWAILIPLVLSGVLKTILSYVCFADTRHHIRYDRKVAADLWDFARYAFRSSLITLAMTQIDKFVFGRQLPLEEFGLYMLAVNLASIPKMFVDSYGPRVLLPSYAKSWRETPDNMRRAFHDKLRFVGPAYCFVVGGLLSFAPAIIALLYQDRYGRAAYYLAFLSIPALFYVTAIAATECLMAVGQIKATYYSNLIRLTALIPATIATLWFDPIEIILIALATSEFLAAAFMCAWLRRRQMFSIRQMVPTVSAALAGIAIGWIACKAAQSIWNFGSTGLLP